MSNICFVYMELKFENEVKKNEFFKKYEKEFSDCKKDKEGYLVNMGNSTNKCYLQDPVIYDHASKEISIDCWVAWSVEHNDIKDIIKEFSNNGVKYIKCEYEELMNHILGEYIYENGKLKDYYLTDKQFNKVYDNHPYSKEENFEDEDVYNDYHNKLYIELRNNPTITEIEL